MQKLYKVNLYEEPPQAPGTVAIAVPVIGMAALWMSLFKQLLHPVLYTYFRTGNESAIAAQGAYSVALVVVMFALLLARAQLGKLLGKRRWTVVVLGVAGALGIALRVFGEAVAAAYIGGVLSATYLPVHFAFWAIYVWRNSTVEAPRMFTLSFALFLIVLGILTVAGANSAWISIACPVVSGAAAIACPQAKEPMSVAATEPVLTHAEAPEPQRNPTGERAPAPSQPSPSQPPDLPDSFAAAYGLSEREAELAAYAHRNLSARQIASELFIAESTVYTHLKRIYRKTDVHSKHELIELIDSWTHSG